MGARRSAAREESWNSVHHSDANDAMDQDDSPLASYRMSTVGEVRRALNPLQAQADRVGLQVEEFAVQLDRHNPRKSGKASAASAALPLIQEYERIAGTTAKRLKHQHGDERKELLKQSRRRLNPRTGTSAVGLRAEEDGDFLLAKTTVDDLLHWEQEHQTWELLGLMLQLQQPADTDVEHTEYEPLQRPIPAPVHRYSSDAAIYQTFLASDNSAWEKHVIAKWLSRVADSAQEDIYEVVEDTIDAQGETEALTAHGWIRAKEGIKQQKRMQSWNRPLDSNVEIGGLLQTRVASEPQVTQLDPDATTRQSRSLPKDDLATERALWLGCWELLKRGRPWSEILDWCKDRSEAWRAVAIRSAPQLQSMDGDTGADLRSRAFWQQSCVRLATGGGVDDYERAVYGLLGGDDGSALKVCKSWNDHLYTLLSCQLIQRYNYFFCEKFRMPPVLSSEDASKTSRISVKHYLEKLMDSREVDDEARSSFKALQASIITGQISEFLIEQGWHLSGHLRELRYGLLGSKASNSFAGSPEKITSILTPDNFLVIRVLTHLLIIYSTIDPNVIKNPLAENLIVAYVDYLGKAGKQQLLPVYASRLRKDRSAICMARQLTYIKDPTERRTILNLMKGYDMEHGVVLLAQIQVIVEDEPPRPVYQNDFPDLSILEHIPDQDIPVIRRGFMGDEPQDWEIDLVDALEWFLLLDGHWVETFNAGVIVYKHFLRTQSWAAATLLAQKISLSRISKLKTRSILGREVDLTALLANGDHHDDEDNFGNEDSGHADMRSVVSEAQQEELVKSSRMFGDLESLALALGALSQWEDVVRAGAEARVQAQEGDKSGLKEWKKDLQRAHEAVSETIEPLMRGWLLSPKDDFEAVETNQIRKRMLPEIVLAYLSVQQIAGTYLHRDHLLQCMNLACGIAEAGNDLCDVFVESGRMAELVTLLANLSQKILSADESTGGRPMIKKRRGDGELLDIWSVGSQVQE